MALNSYTESTENSNKCRVLWLNYALQYIQAEN